MVAFILNHGSSGAGSFRFVHTKRTCSAPNGGQTPRGQAETNSELVRCALSEFCCFFRHFFSACYVLWGVGSVVHAGATTCTKNSLFKTGKHCMCSLQLSLGVASVVLQVVESCACVGSLEGVEHMWRGSSPTRVSPLLLGHLLIPLIPCVSFPS